MKKVLVINYSQSGQLDEILDKFMVGFNSVEIDRVKIYPKEPIPFPWETDIFFDKMPETVLEMRIDLKPYHLKYDNYDLIIIGYQPWFLSPSQPTTALFKDINFTQVLKNTPIVTVIGSRNMWISSQKSIIKWIAEAGGKLIANVPFIDEHQNNISVLTMLHWMLTGKKNKKWGILPLPGVTESNINAAKLLGEPVFHSLMEEDFSQTQASILALGRPHILLPSVLTESTAKKIFIRFARFILKFGKSPKKRKCAITFFKWYLVIILFTVYPIIYMIFFAFNWHKLNRLKQHYLYLGIKKE